LPETKRGWGIYPPPPIYKEAITGGDEVVVESELIPSTYFMPEYEKQATVLHEHGKLMAGHMDGRVGVLKDLIAKTQIDIAEGLTSPPMGDLPTGEALSLWKDKVVLTGFPGSVYILGPEAVKQHALNLLKEGWLRRQASHRTVHRNPLIR